MKDKVFHMCKAQYIQSIRKLSKTDAHGSISCKNIRQDYRNKLTADNYTISTSSERVIVV